MPGDGGVCAGRFALEVGAVFAGVDIGAGAAVGAGEAVGEAGAATAPPPLAVVRPASFCTVAAGTPTRRRSSALANGRPAMIFFAVAGPTPGRASSSFSLAVLR